MTEKPKAGCARPTGGLVGQKESEEQREERQPTKEVKKMLIKLGKATPDFSAPGYYKGEFTSVKLSDYLGKWVVLCFYPGDFTFV